MLDCLEYRLNLLPLLALPPSAILPFGARVLRAVLLRRRLDRYFRRSSSITCAARSGPAHVPFRAIETPSVFCLNFSGKRLTGNRLLS